MKKKGLFFGISLIIVIVIICCITIGKKDKQSDNNDVTSSEGNLKISDDWINITGDCLCSLQLSATSANNPIKLSLNVADYYIIKSYNGYAMKGYIDSKPWSNLEKLGIGEYKITDEDGFYYNTILSQRNEGYDYDYVSVLAYKDEKVIAAAFINTYVIEKSGDTTGSVKKVLKSDVKDGKFTGLSQEEIEDCFKHTFGVEPENDLRSENRGEYAFENNNNLFNEELYYLIDAAQMIESEEALVEKIDNSDIDIIYEFLAKLKLDDVSNSGNDDFSMEGRVYVFSFKNSEVFMIKIDGNKLEFCMDNETKVYNLTDDDVKAFKDIEDGILNK